MNNEFSGIVGEKPQVTGQPGVMGLSRPIPANIPTKNAPTLDRQVQTVFSARPIAAHDFTVSNFGELVIGDGINPTNVDIPNTVPAGYVAVLTSVEIDLYPTFVSSAVPDPVNDMPLEIGITRDSGLVDPDTAQYYGPVSSIKIPTYQVYAPGQTFGIRMIKPPLVVNRVAVAVRFFGTYLPYDGLPPDQTVGSPPTLVIPKPDTRRDSA